MWVISQDLGGINFEQPIHNIIVRQLSTIFLSWTSYGRFNGTTRRSKARGSGDKKARKLLDLFWCIMTDYGVKCLKICCDLSTNLEKVLLTSFLDSVKYKFRKIAVKNLTNLKIYITIFEPYQYFHYLSLIGWKSYKYLVKFCVIKRSIATSNWPCPHCVLEW